MQHNTGIELYGRCNCICHKDQTTHTCTCGWLEFFPRPVEREVIRLRAGKLTSRVAPKRHLQRIEHATANRIYQDKPYGKAHPSSAPTFIHNRKRA